MRDKLIAALTYLAVAAFVVWFCVYLLGPFFAALADEIVRHMP